MRQDQASAPVAQPVASSSPSQSLWNPTPGTETRGLFEHLGIQTSDSDKIKQEALVVLGHCVPPSEPAGTRTGLVIGYVQSGKTLSFTATTALARDNGYRLIIVISGITRNLFDQTDERLHNDLRIKVRDDHQWQDFSNPKPRPDIRQRIATALDWTRDLPGVTKKTVLIMVMKNGAHLENLISLLRGLNLQGVPALVIDDEADQASLNTLVKRGRESATYRRLMTLRQILPHHTFLQYTATPQAPLLLNITDVLSPAFFELLTPGLAYTGGKIFFEKDFRLIRRIDDLEIPTVDHPLSEPPDSLVAALRVFYLGVAVGIMQGQHGSRSMLVHPSKETMQHANYALMVRQIQAHWAATIGSRRSSDLPDQVELLEDFRRAHADLSDTVAELPSFDDLVPYLSSALNITVITEVNAAGGRTPQPEWHSDYAHILIGGEVLNRGYTVKGLTVSYMPRGKGVGNADTIQQRARWFGYKAEYLGYCRVYLSDATETIYCSLVEHEENIRMQLAAHRARGGTLQEWRRALLLSPDLRPTRADVLALGYARGDFAGKWYSPDSPHESASALEQNRRTVEDFVVRHTFVHDTGDPRRLDFHKHLVARGVPAREVYEDLLTSFHVTTPGDVASLTGLLLQIRTYLDEYPDARCEVFQMRPKVARVRYRSVDAENKILNLQQGAYPLDTRDIYPGDPNIYAEHEMTVQLHTLDEIRSQSKEVLASNVPVIAVRLPHEMSNPWLVQDLADVEQNEDEALE